MMGDMERVGIIPLAIGGIFEYIDDVCVHVMFTVCVITVCVCMCMCMCMCVCMCVYVYVCVCVCVCLG